MSDAAIEVEGVSKRYRLGQFNARTLREEVEQLFRRKRGNGGAGGVPADLAEFWALKDVSFKVARGEVLGIIGRNGAGKSTLLKILSRITEPTKGEIRVRGRVASLLEVGTGFHPELSGRENIYLNGAILGMRRREITQKFDEIVAFAEVEKFLDTPVKRYSSGMYVRLAFAVAAHLEPEILVVDEVLAVGDAEFQKKCLGKMKDVSAKAGRTVIFVSHNMLAITNLCNTAVFLENGVLVSSGPSRNMVDAYVKANLSRRVDQRGLCWDHADAPGANGIKLQRVDIRSSDNETIFLSSEINVEISFWNSSSKNVMLDFVLYTSEGSPLLEDWSADDPQWRGRQVPTGLVKTTCTIPPHLLNEGTFRIRIVFFDGDTVRPIYDHDDLVFFDVVDTGDRAVGWNGKFLGPVRPKLGWNTQLISDAAT